MSLEKNEMAGAFIPIQSATEIQDIFKEAVEGNVRVALHMGDSDKIRCHFETHSSGEIHIRRPALQSAAFDSSSPVILTFRVEERLFMGKYVVRVDDSSFMLNPHQGELYRVQRRQDFRVRLHSSLMAEVIIHSINEKETKPLHFELIDLSAGGCAFRLEPTQKYLFPEHSDLELEVKVAGDGLSLQGRVRYLRPDENDSRFLKVGIEFKSFKGQLQQSLFQLVMKLHRQMGQYGA